MSDGNRKPPSSKNPGSRRPIVSRHAHDEFEIDIDVDTDFTELASRPTQDLVFEEDEATSEISQEDLARVIAENSEVDTMIPMASDEKILPIFLPPGLNTSPEVQIPPEASELAPPDLSEEKSRRLPHSGSSGDSNSGPEELFGDVSGIHDEVPIHDLSNPDPEPDPLSNLSLPPADTPSRNRFSKGFTAGMAPLDVSEFSSADSQTGSKRQDGLPVFIRTGPAPMAHSNRVVRRWFQPSIRDIILLVLTVILSIGIWLGWNIYQDYKKTLGWERFNQTRASIEQARVDAIESKQPKVQRDIP